MRSTCSLNKGKLSARSLSRASDARSFFVACGRFVRKALQGSSDPPRAGPPPSQTLAKRRTCSRGGEGRCRRDRALFELALRTGLCVGAAGLAGEDVDLLKNREGLGREQESIVTFGEEAREAISLFRTARLFVAAVYEKTRRDSPLRTTREGADARSMAELKRRLRRGGLPAAISLNALRNLCDTPLSDGADLAPQETWGRLLSTTQKYTHLDAARLREVYGNAHPKA